ncbi:class I SAM-dependent methyltransferase [Bacillus sp. FJAT-45037]|uniref:class I SAM-dependent methyltransferase n=1 Tax=Bacillus sp. FJAT-45037 TaxID=2011007 RepID=UPI000C23C74E|nr:class I SAM-dependent methyltransferase [Bacillus sp. FJAT-45037]
MKTSDVIPFYGGHYPELFEIERRCMDRGGKVITTLDQQLPDGFTLDIGAGNGFTAERLTTPNRTIVGLEPDELMIDLKKKIIWSKGVAQSIPFHSNTFDAAYATWAFFFDGVVDLEKGLTEIERVVKNGGQMIIVDNYGEDEFCSYTENEIASHTENWVKRGFDYQVIHTSFAFDSIDEARKLLTFYFGDGAKSIDRTEIEYKVVMYTKKNVK